jgi:hypothetical protein
VQIHVHIRVTSAMDMATNARGFSYAFCDTLNMQRERRA